MPHEVEKWVAHFAQAGIFFGRMLTRSIYLRQPNVLALVDTVGGGVGCVYGRGVCATQRILRWAQAEPF
jgi:hypothetical protein